MLQYSTSSWQHKSIKTCCLVYRVSRPVPRHEVGAQEKHAMRQPISPFWKILDRGPGSRRPAKSFSNGQHVEGGQSGPSMGAQGDGAVTSSCATLGSELRLTQQAVQAISRCSQEVDFHKAASSLQDAVATLVDCAEVHLLLVDDSRQLWACSEDDGPIPVSPSHDGSLTGSIAELGSCLNLNASQHGSLAGVMNGSREVTSVLCYPVSDVYGNCVAVIEAVNSRKGAFTERDEQLLSLFAMHLGTSLSLARLHTWTRVDQERMLKLFKVFRDLQLETPPLDGLCQSIVRATSELVQAQHLVVWLVDPSSNTVWTRWHSGTTLASQTSFVHLHQLDGSLLADAIQLKEQICVRDISTDTVCTGFGDMLGVSQLPSVIIQPVLDARNRRVAAVLVAADKAPSAQREPLYHKPVYSDSDMAAMGVWAIEVGALLAEQSLQIVHALAQAHIAGHVDGLQGILEAQLQSYTRSPPGSSPFGALAVNGEVADQLGLESSSSSLGAHGTGLLDALPPAPSTQSTQSGSSAGDRCLHKTVSISRDVSMDDTLVNLRSLDVDFSRESFERSRRSSLELSRRSSMDKPRTQLTQQLLRWDVDLATSSFGDLLHFINNIFANSGMVAAFGLEDLRLSNFIGCVAANHRTNPYHNLMHACYVLQATHLIVHATKATGALPDTAHLALLIAALCHDIDHDGRTNSFHVATGSDWARCYNDISVMENRQCAFVFDILGRKDCSLLDHLDKTVQQEVRNLVIAAILATDISGHFALMSTLRQHNRLWSPSDADGTLLLVKAILHAANLSNPARPFPVNLALALGLHEEFRAQATREQELGLTSSPHMTVQGQGVVCQLEVSFIHTIALPLWQRLAACFPALTPAVVRMETNCALFRAISQLAEEEISEVHKLAEQDRERGRLSQPRWMLGEGRWQTKPDREKAIARQPSAAALAQAFSFANSPSVLRGGA